MTALVRIHQAIETVDKLRCDYMARNNTRDRPVRWGLLTLGIGVLVFIIWTGAERWRPSQAQPVQDSTSVPTLESDIEQATHTQPADTASTQEVSATATPAAAPDFTLPTLTGKMVSLSDYSGKPVLINFWATWCVPCRIEMPIIQRVYEKRDGSFVVLAVNLEETHAVIQPFVDELGLTFPILMDSDGLVTWQYRVLGLPTSVFVTPAGTIYREYLGPMEEAFIEETLDEMGKTDENSGTGN